MNSVYSNISFPHLSHRPFFYASFVMSLDGVIFVDRPGYWPIGSTTDYESFTYLRSCADLIIDGKGTALKFGDRTIETIHGEMFLRYRKKEKPVSYGVVANSPDNELFTKLKNSHGFSPLLITSRSDLRLPTYVTPIQVKEKGNSIDLEDMAHVFKSMNYHDVFIDGGPSLIASLLQEGLLDELFITISPRIFGKDERVHHMVEGKLFNPSDINMKLLSSHIVNDEVYLRYQKI